MTAFSYTAQRSVISGHSVGTNYDIDQPMSVINGPGGVPRKRERVALDGTTQTVHHRLEKTWTFRTTDMEQADMEAFLEFLDSVSFGELFTFDPYGTVASPSSPKTGILVSRDETPDRQYVESWQIGFKVRVL